MIFISTVKWWESSDINGFNGWKNWHQNKNKKQKEQKKAQKRKKYQNKFESKQLEEMILKQNNW